ncbi:MAG: DUF2752 domain-containing protein [Flavobacteriales bacterium]
MLQWWNISVNWIEAHLIPCPFKFITGCDCPACGTQRSIVALLKGDVASSWQLNPVGIGICVIGMSYLLGRWHIFKHGQLSARYLSWLLLLIVMLKWGMKIVEGNCCS